MLVGILRTIGTIILVWMAFRWLDRMARRWSGHYRGRSGTSQGDSEPTRGSQETPKDGELGDYIDFEEVDDDS
ncbi:MAG: hypothetical protein OSA37_02665 [Flavobacteriales bacterium]|nr:hypothetical protein [Flavobacteriales bacterium]